jgi:hypothetical protein
MADQATSERVGRKFQEWAQSLPADEQEALAEWMQKAGGDEVKGFQSSWWQQSDAWWNAWQAW